MIRDHPELIWVVQSAENQFELHYERSTLISALRKKGSISFELTSFERGLKHLKMEVFQTTHGEGSVKKWKMNREKRIVERTSRRTQKKRARPSTVSASASDEEEHLFSSDEEEHLFVRPARPLKRRITREALICHETLEEDQQNGRSLLRQELDNFRSMLITSPPPLPPPPLPSFTQNAEADLGIQREGQPQLDFFSEFDALYEVGLC
jgi:hypothetical protein